MKSKKPLQQLKLSTQALSAGSRNHNHQLLTVSGTFHDGDLLLNMKGLRLVTEESESRPSESNELDLLFSLEGLETIKVVRKGSGGVVQLVRHKWVGTLFTLKGVCNTPGCPFIRGGNIKQMLKELGSEEGKEITLHGGGGNKKKGYAMAEKHPKKKGFIQLNCDITPRAYEKVITL
ncbi:unnamed protein product [Camellia sinensis]